MCSSDLLHPFLLHSLPRLMQIGICKHCSLGNRSERFIGGKWLGLGSLLKEEVREREERRRGKIRIQGMLSLCLLKCFQRVSL